MSDPKGRCSEVSAVLVCRNEVGVIENCVRSLLAQVPPPGGFEILVADGMSEDGTRDVLQRLANEHSRLHILDNHRRITPCGMNLGIRAAQGKWIAIMGAHNRYAPDYLLRCFEVAMETGADNVGGSMLCEGKNLVQKAISGAHHSRFSCGGAKWHNPSYEGPVDTLFAGFYNREVFERIGLFDESFVRNQDDELNLRLTHAGGLIWHSPKIRSWYFPRASISGLWRQYSQYGYWKVRVIQKHRLPASWRHLVPGAFVFALSFLALCSLLFASLSVVSSSLSVVRSLLLPASIISFSSLLVFYALAVFVASVFTAAKSGWKLLPILPFVFPCYHFGYGYGFLRGIWDFVIRRKAPSVWSTELTRGTAAAER